MESLLVGYEIKPAAGLSAHSLCGPMLVKSQGLESQSQSGFAVVLKET